MQHKGSGVKTSGAFAISRMPIDKTLGNFAIIFRVYPDIYIEAVGQRASSTFRSK
jgi:hypothetical protein